jgi:uncharacterized protein YjbI with pentapeptide repeats
MDYDGETLSGDLSGQLADHARFLECRSEGCKIEFLNLRGASLCDVAFVDCQLVEPDFAEGKLTKVDFSGSRLVAPELGRSTLSGVDLSGADVTAPRGCEALAERRFHGSS